MGPRMRNSMGDRTTRVPRTPNYRCVTDAVANRWADLGPPMTAPVSPVRADGIVPSRTKEAKMTTPTHLIRIGQLLVLCAVVAVSAALASGASGAVTPSTAPDYQHVAPAGAMPTALGLKADGLRWQGIAKVYRDRETAGSGPTALGLKADGLRWQGIAKVYRDRETAGSGPTALGLKADGLRWQGIANVYQEQQSTAGGTAFDWGDWAIGLGSGIVLILAPAGLLAFALQRRHRLQAA